MGGSKKNSKVAKTIQNNLVVGHTSRSALSLFFLSLSALFHSGPFFARAHPPDEHTTTECNSEVKTVQRLFIAETTIGSFLFLFTLCVVSG